MVMAVKLMGIHVDFMTAFKRDRNFLGRAMPDVPKRLALIHEIGQLRRAAPEWVGVAGSPWHSAEHAV